MRKTEVDEGFYNNLRHQNFSGDFEQLRELAVSRCGFQPSDETIRGAIRVLADWNLIRVTEDAYSGTFYKIWAERLAEELVEARKQLAETVNDNLRPQSVLTRRSDFPRASALLEHEVFEDYDDHGEAWLTKALEGLKFEVEAGGSDLDQRFPAHVADESIPASDRVVKLNDNQISELDNASTELLSAISQKNEIGGHEGFRELILGQIRAGRELFRSGCARTYLVQLALVDILKFLVKRYEREVVGALASALLTALTNHFGIIP